MIEQRIFDTFDKDSTYPITLPRTATYISIRNGDAVLPLMVEITTEYGRTINLPLGNLEAYSDPIEQFRILNVTSPTLDFTIAVGA